MRMKDDLEESEYRGVCGQGGRKKEREGERGEGKKGNGGKKKIDRRSRRKLHSFLFFLPLVDRRWPLLCLLTPSTLSSSQGLSAQ